MADCELYLFVWSTEKGQMNLLRKIGKLFLCDSTLPNDEICSDGSVSMHDISTTSLQEESMEHYDDIDYL